MNLKQKMRITTNEYIFFLESSFVGVNRSSVLIYSNQDNNSQRFKAKIYYSQKWLMIIIKSSSMEKLL